MEELVRLLCWPTSKQETLETLLQLSKPEHTGDWTLAYLRSRCEPLQHARSKHTDDIGIW